MGRYMGRFKGSFVSRLGSIYRYVYDRFISQHVGQFSVVLQVWTRSVLAFVHLDLFCV